MSIWQRLRATHRDAPFFALAPMYEVTDTAFRQMFVRYGAPAVMYTEFTSAEALLHPVGVRRIWHLLWHTPAERPLIAHLFTAQPDVLRRAARIVAQWGFAGIDINMGCPADAICRQGAGAALITQPERAQALVAAARAGVRDAGCAIPVSVKTRIGFRAVAECEQWITQILAARPDALAVHLRTRAEMSAVPAHWACMPRIVALRDAISPATVLIGNGDVTSVAEGVARARASGCDGIMVGRGVFGAPWFFAATPPPSPAQRVRALQEHVALYVRHFTGRKPFEIMQRHIGAYLRGFPGARAARQRAMAAPTPAALQDVLRTLIQALSDDR